MGDMLAGLGLGAEQRAGLNFSRDGRLGILAGARPFTVSTGVNSTGTERQWGDEVGKRGENVGRGKGGGGKGSGRKG